MMMSNTYPYQLPPLPYAYDALEPSIDEETMRYHHDKHFQNYVNGLNKALEPYPRLQQLTLPQLLSNPRILPPQAKEAILHNGGGVYNHNFYFDALAPIAQGGHQPTGLLLDLINATYNSFENFKKVFSDQALSVFGSGYTSLTLRPQGGLQIINLKNQDTLLPFGLTPLMLVDVWEHAYYLKYRNARADYVAAIWNVLTYPVL